MVIAAVVPEIKVVLAPTKYAKLPAIELNTAKRKYGALMMSWIETFSPTMFLGVKNFRTADFENLIRVVPYLLTN